MNTICHSPPPCKDAIYYRQKLLVDFIAKSCSLIEINFNKNADQLRFEEKLSKNVRLVDGQSALLGKFKSFLFFMSDKFPNNFQVFFGKQ